MDLFPDLATTDDDELERLLRAAEDEGDAISARRRALHLRIDSLREERVSRLRGQVEAGTLEVSTPGRSSVRSSRGRAPCLTTTTIPSPIALH